MISKGAVDDGNSFNGKTNFISQFIWLSNTFNYNIYLWEIEDFIFLYADTITYSKVKTCRKTKHVGWETKFLKIFSSSAV